MKYSFILPAYKARFFKEALDSILAQTYKDFELIIVNDASPEDLTSVVKSYDDPRIRYYINEENIGGKNLVAQWNHCLEYANGEYVILASDDDLYHLEYLEKMNVLVDKYPEVNVFRPRVQLVDDTNNIIHIEGYFDEYISQLEYLYLWTNQWIESGIPYYIFKKSALEEVSGFADYPLAWFSDDASVLRLSKNGMAISNQILFSFRYSGISITTTLNSEKKLQKKILATRMFYDEVTSFLNQFKANNKYQQYLVSSIKENLEVILRENKIRGQLFNSSFLTILKATPKVLEFSFYSWKYMVRCYCSYFLSLIH